MSFSQQRVLLQTLCLLVGILCLNTSQAVVIDLPGLGQIDGTTTQSHWTGRTIYQYKGIPFAEPPVGDLRFKTPVKFASPWTGVRNFSDFGPACPQGSGFLSQLNLPLRDDAAQDEDCLSLNVYTNKIAGGGVGSGFPVMVFIHGGAFIGGHAQYYLPNYLVDRDVVLVIPQYRLGPLGFLSLKNEEIPGNQGMLDVVLALEWVRDNIEHFGGDPSRVTVFGQSAGAAAVTSLLFSPLVEGLFHGIISQSGSILGTWATDPDPVPHGKAIALLAGCVQSNEAALAACLRGKTANQILAAHTAFLVAEVAAGGRGVGGHHLVWDEAGDNSFLRTDPAASLVKGDFMHIPMMAGVTKHEATDLLGKGHKFLLKPWDLDQDVEFMKRKAVQMILDYGGIEDQTGYTTGFIRGQYFIDSELGNFTAMIPGMMDILGVAIFKACSFTMASEMNMYSNTFLYSFNYFGKYTTFPDPNPYPFDGGINHSDELFYLFPMERELEGEDDVMAQHMVDLWTSFATNGSPSSDGFPEWSKMTEAEGPYMKFDSPSRMCENYVDEEFMIAVREGISNPDLLR